MMQPQPFSQTLVKQPIDLFREATLRAWLYRLWARLTRRSSRLLDLDETLCCTQVQNSHYAGVRPVCIDCIQGTQGKSDAFDGMFHPVKAVTRTRWLSVAREKLVSAPNRWDAPLLKIGPCEYSRCLYTAARRSSGDPHEPTDTDDSEG